MGKTGKNSSSREIAEQLRRDSRWPMRFAGLGHRRVEASLGALDFEDVTMRCFPLRAKMNSLQRFCDRYLNMDVPPEIARFRPAAPYVLLTVVNYGRMSAATSNLGWSAQNEILFTVPLIGHWNQWNAAPSGVGGESVMIHEFATVSPFIFVDDDWSVAAGREVYGWPKVPCRLEAGLNPWLRDPRLRRRLLTLQTLVLPELYAGRETEFQTLLEIEQETPRIEMPADLNYVMNPFLRMSKSVLSTLGAAPDLMEMLAQLVTPTGAPGGAASEASPAPIVSLLTQLFRSLTQMPPDLYGNQINLKQFRAPVPRAACYQALNNSRMHVRRFNHGGLMGSAELLRGDPTGGISVVLHRHDAYPILESLGLEVDAEIRRDGKPAAVLKPLVPFWMSLDFRYEPARRICWRAEMAKGETKEGESGHQSGWNAWHGEQRLDPVVPIADGIERIGTTSTRLPEFNTVLGPVVEAVEGPFDFHDVTIRVLPLRASSARLQEALPSVGRQTPYRAVPRSQGGKNDSWVFLVVTSYGRMSSTANDIGWWARNEVGFAFVAESEELIGWGTEGLEGLPMMPPQKCDLSWLHWPYMFADSPIAVTEGREVLGLPTTYCRILNGVDPWLEHDGPVAKDRLLSLSALDYPAIGVGQEAVDQELFEVERLVEESDDGESSVKSSALMEFCAKHLEAFADGVRLRNLSLKEFRDEDSPDRPCYQSVVGFERVIRKRKGHGEIKEDDGLFLKPMRGSYQVRFHRTPSWDIVDALGLKVKSREEGPSGSDTLVCEVIDPFWMRVDLRAELPVDLLHRSVNRPWSFPGYLPFVYNELWFRDFYDKQLGFFEKFMKTYLGGDALPKNELSLEARRRMNDLRREWECDPSIPLLETLDDLVSKLRDPDGGGSRFAPILDLDQSTQRSASVDAAWRDPYLGLYVCTNELGEELEVEIAAEGWGLDALFESTSAVLFANLEIGETVEEATAAASHVALLSQPLYRVEVGGALQENVFCTDDLENRLVFELGEGTERTRLKWEMGPNLDKGAKPTQTWTGVWVAEGGESTGGEDGRRNAGARATQTAPKERLPTAGDPPPGTSAKPSKAPAKKPAKRPVKRSAKKSVTKSTKKSIKEKLAPVWPDPRFLKRYDYVGVYEVDPDGAAWDLEIWGAPQDDARGKLTTVLYARTRDETKLLLVPDADHPHVFCETNAEDALLRLTFRFRGRGKKASQVEYKHRMAAEQSWTRPTEAVTGTRKK